MRLTLFFNGEASCNSESIKLPSKIRVLFIRMRPRVRAKAGTINRRGCGFFYLLSASLVSSNSSSTRFRFALLKDTKLFLATFFFSHFPSRSYISFSSIIFLFTTVIRSSIITCAILISNYLCETLFAIEIMSSSN